MYKLFLLVLIIGVILISGCTKQEENVVVDKNSNISLKLEISPLFGLTEFYSISNNGTISLQSVDYENKLETQYTKIISREELLNLTAFIVDNGFFTKSFKSSFLVMDRASMYAKHLIVSVNGLSRNATFGDLIITDNREILDQISSRIESLIAEKEIVKPNKECLEGVEEFLNSIQGSKYYCQNDDDCAVLNESFFVEKGTKISVVSRLYGVIDTIKKQNTQETEAKIQSLKMICKGIESREVGLGSLSNRIPRCIQRGCFFS